MVKKRTRQGKKSRTQSLQDDVNAFQFKLIHRRYASDEYWEKWSFIHKEVGRELKRRRMIQRLARRERDDFKFCKAIARYIPPRYIGGPIIRWPDSFGSLNVIGYKSAVRLNPDSLIHPEMYSDSWGRVPKNDDPDCRDWMRKAAREIGWMGAKQRGRVPFDDTTKIRKIDNDDEARGRSLRSNEAMAKLLYGETETDGQRSDTLEFIKEARRKSRR